MYVLLGIAQCLLCWGFWAELPSIFYSSLLLLVLSLMYLDYSRIQTKGRFFDMSIRAMPKTECCLLHKMWSSPKSVLWSTMLFRTLSAIVALAAIVVSWRYRKDFQQGHYFLISAIWSTTSVIWILSCVPMFICLIQCAASSTFNSVQCRIESKEIILRFRKVSSLWLVHDVTLGIFWLYLSFMLYDLSDDEDDSEWRTIFLSMLSWHILVTAFHEIYLAHLVVLQPISPPITHSAPCCGPKNGRAIWSFVTILSYVGMYIVIILRFNSGPLLTMGADSVFYPIVYSVCQVLFVMSKWFQYEEDAYVKSQKNKQIEREKNASLALDF